MHIWLLVHRSQCQPFSSFKTLWCFVRGIVYVFPLPFFFFALIVLKLLWVLTSLSLYYSVCRRDVVVQRGLDSLTPEYLIVCSFDRYSEYGFIFYTALSHSFQSSKIYFHKVATSIWKRKLIRWIRWILDSIFFMIIQQISTICSRCDDVLLSRKTRFIKSIIEKSSSLIIVYFILRD